MGRAHHVAAFAFLAVRVGSQVADASMNDRPACQSPPDYNSNRFQWIGPPVCGLELHASVRLNQW
jgi:hypothetical protein